MANKVKDIKKKGRRLRRSIRKTLGTLFLVSALVVAAIPVDYLQADESFNAGERVVTRPDVDKDEMKVTIVPDNPPSDKYWSKTRIPKIKNNPDFADKIFKSADLIFRFCVSNLKSEDRYAVIVGYDTNKIDSETLTIPETLDAYDIYKGNSCAIGGDDGEFLFYKDTYTVSESDGTITTVEKYYPCYFGEIVNWKSKEYDVNNNPEGRLYYIKGFNNYDQLKEYAVENNDTSVTPVEGQQWFEARGTATQRYKNINVYYIGNEYVDPTTGELVEAGKTVNNAEGDADVGMGVFTNVPVSSIDVKPNLIGIGDYAFAGAPIDNVNLSHTVKEIGNYAFSRCTGLNTFTIDSSATDVVIGDHAFYYCSALGQFDAHSVTKIGDSAFEECRNLKEVILEGTEESGTISNIGYYAFANCNALKEIVLPHGYFENDLRVSTFWNCDNLSRIYAMESVVDFVDDGVNGDYYSFEDFRSDVGGDFYFEGPKGAAFETTVVDKYFVYKYEKQEVYEKKEADPFDNSKNATFEVTRLGEGTGAEKGNGSISNVKIDSKLETLNIPENVGPLSVVEIGEGGFRNNLELKNVIIPQYMTNIGKEAFMGCHNLENVLFENPINLAPIGENAFKTQMGSTATGSATLNFISNLPFTSSNNSIVNEAFNYAMNTDNFINSDSQTRSYVKYYTGWPSNLVVENVSGKATLTEYPTYTSLLEGTLDSYYYKPDVTEHYKKAAVSAAMEALGIGDNSGTGEEADYKNQIKDAVKNIVIPVGVDAIAKDLFKNKEEDEKNTVKDNGVDESHIPEKKLTAYGLKTIDDNAFEAAEYLQEVGLYGNTESIGSYAFRDCINLNKVTVVTPTRLIASYAFQDCVNLSNVTVTAPLEEMGVAPFIGCDKLNNVKFGEEANFTCDESIIYELDQEGTKKALVEYLNGRDEDTAEVGRDETAGITEVYPEAFKNTNVRVVDLRDASRDFKKLTESTFQNTLNLQDVYLPVSCDTIGEDAFTDSAIRHLYIFNTACWLDKDRFKDTDGDGKTNLEGMYIHCPPQNAACTAFANENTKAGAQPLEGTFYVRFWGYNDETGKVDKLIEGYGDENAKLGANFIGKEPPKDEVPEMNGYKFVRWDPNDRVYGNVTENLDIYAVYPSQYVVKFYDKDDWVTPLSTVRAFRVTP